MTADYIFKRENTLAEVYIKLPQKYLASESRSLRELQNALR